MLQVSCAAKGSLCTVLYVNLKASLGAKTLQRKEKARQWETELSHRARKGRVQRQMADQLS